MAAVTHLSDGQGPLPIAMEDAGAMRRRSLQTFVLLHTRVAPVDCRKLSNSLQAVCECCPNCSTYHLASASLAGCLLVLCAELVQESENSSRNAGHVHVLAHRQPTSLRLFRVMLDAGIALCQRMLCSTPNHLQGLYQRCTQLQAEAHTCLQEHAPKQHVVVCAVALTTHIYIYIYP
jgi:hypothetical protein